MRSVYVTALRDFNNSGLKMIAGERAKIPALLATLLVRCGCVKKDNYMPRCGFTNEETP